MAKTEKLSYPDDFLHIIQQGLPKAARKKRILIIGAGMAGLVAGQLLKQAGHQVTILEGNNRIGGRVYTVRKPFTYGNYIDVGAMRLPSNHVLVQEYIRKFQLPTQPFLNTTPDDLLLINGKQLFQEDYKENPDLLDFPLLPWERGKTAKELFLSSVQPFLDLYEKSTPEEQEELLDQYSNYAMGEYLRNNPLGPSMSTNAVRKVKLLLGIEGFPEFSFLDILTDITFPIFSEETEFKEITGGNDRLPYAFLPSLCSDIYFNQKVKKIFQGEYEIKVEAENQLDCKRTCWRADYVLSTIPFTTFQFIEVYPFSSISFKKRQAIQELTNVPAVKVGIEFKSRFWERYPVGNITSDLPMRFMYLPSHDRGKPGPGVMLASYTWGQNAMLWNSLSDKEIIEVLLENLCRVYGPIVYQEYLNSVVFNWSRNPFSAGCFTLFTPGQSLDLEEVIPSPEGRLHFAGEHTSSFHGWIEGAVESGIRAAYELNAREGSSKA
ncbi:flavin monoamine oxidase family protein [Halobacillus sp. H74]|uniref:flavin monoamine oxidase family protein n=1 Tax=Halobacillus sp. H74 TaxID=3457436 RepID=UPI003FCD1EA0